MPPKAPGLARPRRAARILPLLLAALLAACGPTLDAGPTPTAVAPTGTAGAADGDAPVPATPARAATASSAALATLAASTAPAQLTIGILQSATHPALDFARNEPNSVATTDKARAAAPPLGLTLIDRIAARSGDTLPAAEVLAGYGVDAFFVSTTNSVVAGLDS